MKEMVYGPDMGKREILYSGEYNGHQFYIVSYQSHPCCVQGEKVEHIMAACHMSKQEVLHAIAQYSAEYRHIPSECDFCPWRSGDRPCVLPQSVCRF